MVLRMTQMSTATQTATQWLRDNELNRKTTIRNAVHTATGQAIDYGKAYAMALWAGDDPISRLVRDALKANLDLPHHGELANCA